MCSRRNRRTKIAECILTLKINILVTYPFFIVSSIDIDRISSSTVLRNSTLFALNFENGRGRSIRGKIKSSTFPSQSNGFAIFAFVSDLFQRIFHLRSNCVGSGRKRKKKRNEIKGNAKGGTVFLRKGRSFVSSIWPR